VDEMAALGMGATAMTGVNSDEAGECAVLDAATGPDRPSWCRHEMTAVGPARRGAGEPPLCWAASSATPAQKPSLRVPRWRGPVGALVGDSFAASRLSRIGGLRGQQGKRQGLLFQGCVGLVNHRMVQ